MRTSQKLAALSVTALLVANLAQPVLAQSGPISNLITAYQQYSLAGSSTITPDGGTSTVYGNGCSTSYGPNSSFIYTHDGGCMVDGVSCPN
jgi:hypothetical protein